jgi:hypothetical protein
VGALGGLLTAVLVDLDAWKSSAKGAKFDLETASRRWVYGAVAGGATALGIGR